MGSPWPVAHVIVSLMQWTKLIGSWLKHTWLPSSEKSTCCDEILLSPALHPLRPRHCSICSQAKPQNVFHQSWTDTSSKDSQSMPQPCVIQQIGSVVKAFRQGREASQPTAFRSSFQFDPGQHTTSSVSSQWSVQPVTEMHENQVSTILQPHTADTRNIRKAWLHIAPAENDLEGCIARSRPAWECFPRPFIVNQNRHKCTES